LLRNGDRITFDISKRRLDAALTASEWKYRRAKWRKPICRYASGVFAKYASGVSSASEGAVTGPAARQRRSMQQGCAAP
jgi:dihydroxy-acid dehydratase